MIGPCPRCGEPLAERAFGGVRLDGCNGCGGLWFDTNELNSLTRDPQTGLMEVERAFTRAVSAGAAAGVGLCPRCSVPLYQFSFPHTPSVKLDACPQCKGIFADDGELQQIAERVATARPQPAVAKPDEERDRERARTVTGFLLSAPCPQCRTNNPAASTICWACGAPLKTRSVLRLCPRCDMPLDEVPCGMTGARIDSCAACSGVWFEAGEVSVLFQLGPEAVRQLQAGFARAAMHAADRVAHCPGCHYTMERLSFGTASVQVDVCTNCRSLWMDSGELMPAYAHLESGGTFAVSHNDPWGERAD